MQWQPQMGGGMGGAAHMEAVVHPAQMHNQSALYHASGGHGVPQGDSTAPLERQMGAMSFGGEEVRVI